MGQPEVGTEEQPLTSSHSSPDEIPIVMMEAESEAGDALPLWRLHFLGVGDLDSTSSRMTIVSRP